MNNNIFLKYLQEKADSSASVCQAWLCWAAASSLSRRTTQTQWWWTHPGPVTTLWPWWTSDRPPRTVRVQRMPTTHGRSSAPALTRPRSAHPYPSTTRRPSCPGTGPVRVQPSPSPETACAAEDGLPPFTTSKDWAPTANACLQTDTQVKVRNKTYLILYYHLKYNLVL